MAFLSHELLAMIFEEHADDLSTLHSCMLVNRNWCVVALQYLWAKPFTLLLSSGRRTIDGPSKNLMITFIRCFTDTDINSLMEARLCKRYSKRFPFDYSLYLKEIRFKEIEILTRQCTGYNSFHLYYMRVGITRLAMKYCPNLNTLSLRTENSAYIDQSRFLLSINNLSRVQNLSWYLDLDDNIFSALSRAARNLKSISVKCRRSCYFKLGSRNHGLQKLVRSQRQLKTFTLKHVTVSMRSVFELLESQSNSLESLVLSDIDIDPDDSNIEPIRFHHLTRIYIKNCRILKTGLNPIFEADLPELQQLKFENNYWKHKSDWIPLQDLCLIQNKIVYSGNSSDIIQNLKVHL
ncbi:5080_t:CDS:1 [Paraglomus occultum]|uniref:5080_t:CDS:1 n=1 Tax=Paraglomus occultum TaxID=144539 RepID=A0A9N9H7S3_9GLOM|nr:5080_t:CDS:1 [Paraglomus occultum]